MSLFGDVSKLNKEDTAKSDWLIARNNRMNMELAYSKNLAKRDVIFEIECARHLELTEQKAYQHKIHQKTNKSYFIITILILMIETSEFTLELLSGTFSVLHGG